MIRIFKPFVFLIAAIYFLVDAVFFALFKPVLRRLADCWVFESLRAWIVSLRPYPTLALFIVPVILLEPVKPVAAYLPATGHIVGGLDDRFHDSCVMDQADWWNGRFVGGFLVCGRRNEELYHGRMAASG